MKAHHTNALSTASLQVKCVRSVACYWRAVTKAFLLYILDLCLKPQLPPKTNHLVKMGSTAEVHPNDIERSVLFYQASQLSARKMVLNSLQHPPRPTLSSISFHDVCHLYPYVQVMLLRVVTNAKLHPVVSVECLDFEVSPS